ncbi:MAG: response regulator, partial [Rhodospirillales bacterium]
MAKKNNPSCYIVDDDPFAVETMTVLLKDAGFSVTSSTKSTGIINGIAKKKPDVVLGDIMMPGVDGFQLCKQVREHKGLKKTKFIIVSAKTYDFDQKRSFEFGANGYIRKPVNKETFSDKV